MNKAALSSKNQFMKMADHLATKEQNATGEVAIAEARLERAKFRAWMRVQASAEQGQAFKPVPAKQTIKKGE